MKYVLYFFFWHRGVLEEQWKEVEYLNIGKEKPVIFFVSVSLLMEYWVLEEQQSDQVSRFLSVISCGPNMSL